MFNRYSLPLGIDNNPKSFLFILLNNLIEGKKKETSGKGMEAERSQEGSLQTAREVIYGDAIFLSHALMADLNIQ